MTPQEKAIELLAKYDYSLSLYGLSDNELKRASNICTLHLIGEIFKEISEHSPRKSYWADVLNIIAKL